MTKYLENGGVGQVTGVPLCQAEVCRDEVVLVRQPQVLVQAAVAPLICSLIFVLYYSPHFLDLIKVVFMQQGII